MISHYIFVTEKKKPEPVSPPPWSITKYARLSQEELNNLIMGSLFEVGMFVTLSKTPVQYLSQVEAIVGIETDADKVGYRYQDSDPMFLQLLCLPKPDNGHLPPWVRFDSTISYRKLTDQEYQDIIKPNHDFVQNHIKQWKEDKSRYHSGSSN